MCTCSDNMSQIFELADKGNCKQRKKVCRVNKTKFTVVFIKNTLLSVDFFGNRKILMIELLQSLSRF